MESIKNRFITFLYAIVIGALAGALIWLFLRVMNLSIFFLWEYIPSKFKIPLYPLIICLIFGLLTGLFKKYHGDGPEGLEVVMSEVKKKGRWEYNNMFSSILCSILPLIGGASIGPEAGLAGIIAGLCTWISDNIKLFYGNVKEIASIGLSSTLGTIFTSPLFGFSSILEDEDVMIPKRDKAVLYFASILGCFGIFSLFKKLFGGLSGLDIGLKTSSNEVNYIYVIFLCFIGILLGFIYYGSKKITVNAMKPFKSILIKCIIGGFILGICGLFLPLSMFSGEEEISIVLNEGANMGFVILILTGVVKIILTNICIESGLKGGHFFPIIFSGISVGYAFSLIMDIDPVLSMAVVTSSVVAFVLKKPLATVLLLMIVFPVNLIPIMLGVAFFSVFIKMPKFLND